MTANQDICCRELVSMLGSTGNIYSSGMRVCTQIMLKAICYKYDIQSSACKDNRISSEQFLHDCWEGGECRPSTHENDTKECSIVSFKEHFAECFTDHMPDRCEWCLLYGNKNEVS